MSKKKTAPFNNLEEIAVRKRQVNSQIKRQERLIGRDIDSYREEISSLKGVWNGVANLGRFSKERQNAEPLRATNNVSRIVSAFSFGVKVVKWLADKRKRKK